MYIYIYIYICIYIVNPKYGRRVTPIYLQTQA